jgi:nitrate reductase gamma subunit
MSLLDFARGPAMQWSLIVLVVGVLWRLLGTMLLMHRKDLSKPREHKAVVDGILTIATRSLPAHQFEKKIRFQHYTGYAWHIGFFITVLFFAPHVLFFEDILGFGWPSLPNSFILVAGAITLAILIAVTIRRMTDPILRLISNADDYISLAVTIAPIITGILATAHFGLRYETMLALHWLSVDALFLWFPFGKLMHAVLIFPTRYRAGADYGRRGVRA